ncbi:hypothetical protein BLOT_014901, partial [Blomia tropicalis]
RRRSVTGDDDKPHGNKLEFFQTKFSVDQLMERFGSATLALKNKQKSLPECDFALSPLRYSALF